MNVLELREGVINGDAAYIRNFFSIEDDRIQGLVEKGFAGGFLWPNPLVQVNPSLEPGETIGELVERGLLLPACRRIFRDKAVNAGFELERNAGLDVTHFTGR